MHLKLRRAMCLGLGLVTAACGDGDGSSKQPTPPSGDAGMDAQHPSDDAAVIVKPDGQVVVPNARAGRIVSMAPSYVVVGEAYRYRVKSNSKSSGLEMEGAPSGMTSRGAMVEWTPTEAQTGSHRMTVRAVSGDSVAEQEITVKVAKATLRAQGDVGVDEGGSVYSDNPQNARMLGAGVYVPPRSVAAQARMTVSELDEAPSTPNAAGRAKAVRFGPEGQVFDVPARITLPLPEASNSSSARVNVYVYQPTGGRWERVPLVALDTSNGLVTAKARHFSVYAAIESALDLSVELAPSPDDSACPDSLLARAWVDSALDEVELASLNNLPEELRAKIAGEKPSVLDLLATPGFTGSFRAVQVFELTERAGESEVVREQRLIATTLYMAPGGSATITHSDALGNVLGSKDYPLPALALDEIAARLRGGATSASFELAPSSELGLGARVHLLYFAGDASRDPINADDLGIAAVERAPVFALADAPTAKDGDCDGVMDAFDGSDDRLVAGIQASPRAVVNLLAGDSAKLTARVVNGTPVSETWQVIAGEGASLTQEPGVAATRVFTATSADRYLVSYRAVVGDKTLEHVFALDVGEQPVENTPPVCRPSRDIETGRVGDALALSATLSDAETSTSALRLEWGLMDGEKLVASSAISSRAERALFAPLDAGNFEVGCRAFDGQIWGPVGRVKFSVVPRGQNRAPTDLTLSPAAGRLNVGETITLRASAKDPDGDVLAFNWKVDGSSVDAQTAGNQSALQYMATKEGTIRVDVEVTEVREGAAPPVGAFARLLVGAAPTSGVDGDMDGWQAGTGALADCNDADPKVHPGAPEKCGDQVDANCDGAIRLVDCDDDGFVAGQGDCNDSDPTVHAQAQELCDGIDNNCNQDTDEGFGVGTACRVGVGECSSAGTLACAADKLSAQCSAKPLNPKPEQCGNGLDDDCDRAIDEDCGGVGADAGVGMPVDASTGGGPIDSALPPATVADAAVGGCVQSDEVCDLIDNDCNGKVDDVPLYPCETGKPGACMAGTFRCVANALECVPNTFGGSEICNQIDDDCDGSIDEGNVCACVPTSGELCADKLDNDCDGLVDGADPDCGCKPSQEDCFDDKDNDCDGAVDLADSDCCTYQGKEICNDRIDNDCDLYVDGADPECFQGVYADSCANPGSIAIWESVSGYFDGAKPDIVSSCADRGVDLVYSFVVKDPGHVRLTWDAPQPFGWSIQSGACDPTKQSLEELACNPAEPVPVEPGVYYLVIEGGDKGNFWFQLEYIAPPIN